MIYGLPKKGATFTFFVGLRSQADPNLFQVNPTLAAGDFQISIDGGALTNLANLPAVAPAAGRLVQIVLTAAEMNGDNITVVASDAAGAEWCDEAWNIHPQIDTIVLQTLSMGIRSDMKNRVESLEALVAARVETVRIAVLDLAQAIMRGKK